MPNRRTAFAFLHPAIAGRRVGTLHLPEEVSTALAPRPRRLRLLSLTVLLIAAAGCGGGSTPGAAPEDTATACSNFADDDRDGLIDCADTDCDAFTLCQTGDAGYLCGPATCPTGCCEGNVCRAGTTTAACGASGGACDACTAGTEACSAGSCQPLPCGPSTCASGCCQGGVCQAGNTLAACGTGGGTCSACGGSQACQSGSCQNVVPTCSHDGTAGTDTCTGTNICDCPPGSTDCVSTGSCTNAFGRLYRFTIDSVAVPNTNGGADWDFGGGAPDLYVSFGVDGVGVLTSASGTDSFANSYTGSTVDVSVAATTSIAADVWDEDGISDDYAFSCSLNPVTAATLRSGVLACSGAGASVVVFIDPLF